MLKILLITAGILTIFPYFCRHNKKEEKQVGAVPTKNQYEMPYLTSEKRQNIFKEHGGSASNTGSIEGQIALLTERIANISSHLQENKKDFSTHRGLMKMVGQRKRLLSYMQKHNLQGYRALIEKLGLRK